MTSKLRVRLSITPYLNYHPHRNDNVIMSLGFFNYAFYLLADLNFT
jgi:hypothetical protein